MTVSCQLMRRTHLRDEVEIPLAGRGQTAQFIDELFTGTYTGNFMKDRCAAAAEKLFAAVALEMDSQAIGSSRPCPWFPLPHLEVRSMLPNARFPTFRQRGVHHFRLGAREFRWTRYRTLGVAIYFYDGEGHLIVPGIRVVGPGIQAYRVRRDGALAVKAQIARRRELTNLDPRARTIWLPVR